MLHEDGSSHKPDLRPTFHVDGKTLPAIKDWEVGEKYMIVLAEAELVTLVKDKEFKEFGEKDAFNATFRVGKVHEIDELSDKQMEKLIGKARSS